MEKTNERIIQYDKEYINLNNYFFKENKNKIIKDKNYLLNDGYFMFAGRHILFDFFGSPFITDITYLISSMKKSVLKTGAEIIHENFHVFGESKGITGVLILKESHASLHTWPECELMTFDIFMCGACDPYTAFDELKHQLKPKEIHVSFSRRGIVEVIKQKDAYNE